MLAGTIGSAAGIAALAGVSLLRLAEALPAAAFLLGFANGMFAVAALNAMMELSAAGGRGREGLRMGLWGASQAVAFAAGGLGAGTILDLARRLAPDPAVAYAAVFVSGALLFLLAAHHARRLGRAVDAHGRSLRTGVGHGAEQAATP
jgi:BCD family chlorophyll transporter-like MFS transporter